MGSHEHSGTGQQDNEGFSIAGAPDEKTAQFIGKTSEQPLSVGRQAAELDRFGELFNLESRVTQYWVDWRLVFAVGIPGLIVFFGSLFMPTIDRALGQPLGSALPWIRLGMMMVGA